VKRYRKAIETSPCGSIAVTVSVGVSSIKLGAKTPLSFSTQADKALMAPSARDEIVLRLG